MQFEIVAEGPLNIILGCMTCIGNSGPLNETVAKAIDEVLLYIT